MTFGGAAAERRPTLRRVVVDATREFWARTGISGLSHAHDSPYRPLRLVWLALFAVGVVFTAIDVITVIREYLEHPHITRMDVVHERSAYFPAVTVCNQNRLDCEQLVKHSLHASPSRMLRLVLKKSSCLEAPGFGCPQVWRLVAGAVTPEWIKLFQPHCLQCRKCLDYKNWSRRHPPADAAKNAATYAAMGCNSTCPPIEPPPPNNENGRREEGDDRDFGDGGIDTPPLPAEGGDRGGAETGNPESGAAPESVPDTGTEQTSGILNSALDSSETSDVEGIKYDTHYDEDDLLLADSSVGRTEGAVSADSETSPTFGGADTGDETEQLTGTTEQDAITRNSLTFNADLKSEMTAFSTPAGAQMSPEKEPQHGGTSLEKRRQKRRTEHQFEKKRPRLNLDDETLSQTYDDDMRFLFYYMTLSEAQRTDIGIPFSDFVKECTYLGTSCTDESLFQTVSSPLYGNCFTFNSNVTASDDKMAGKRKTGLTGETYSLNILLDLKHIAYPPVQAATKGARIVIHAPDQHPDVERAGLNLYPNSASSLAVQQVRLAGRRQHDSPPPSCRVTQDAR
ncbi:uncharacterized protein LOC119100607 [Pollicipes pollicipes]|uniref:uncharacterized protein LOC119100607 n=1 Tax=Pollicipes pollicipes TaxID=41117 RepID=UPI001884FD74|nr:uncharacterized protein LOC119100607 [Pollicipes pollicipes]